MANLVNLVTCSCNSCDEVLCISLNEWAEFTPSYSTYTSGDLFSNPGLDQIDQNRPGLKDSELEGCTVQALQCRQCHELTGVKCVAITPEKEQYRDRVFLKLDKMRLKSVASGQIVKANIGPRLKSVPPPHSLSGKPATLRPRNPGTQRHVSPDNRPEVKTIKRDITLLFKTVETLQHGLNSAVEAIKDLKTRQDKQSSLSEDLLVLTDNVTDVNRRLGEVDSLKLEMKLMQSKIARLEEERRNSSRTRAMSKRPKGFHKAQMTISRPQFEKSSPQIDPSFLEQQLIDGQSTARSSICPSNKGSQPQYGPEVAGRGTHPYQNISALQETHGQENGASRFSGHDGVDEDSDATESYDEQSLDPHEYRLTNGSDDEESFRSSYRAYGITHQDEYPDETLPSGKRRRTNFSHLPPDLTTNALEYSSPQYVRRPSPRLGTTTEGSSYRSIWAPEGTFRNEQGFVVTRDGRIDGRSLRYEGKGHYKRDGPRDEEGYLLKVDGSRDKRSVRIIDGMKRRREEREMRERDMREGVVQGEIEKADGEEVKLAENGVEETAFAVAGVGAESIVTDRAERNETNNETTATTVTSMQPEADTAREAEYIVHGEVGMAISV